MQFYNKADAIFPSPRDPSEKGLRFPSGPAALEAKACWSLSDHLTNLLRIVTLYFHRVHPCKIEGGMEETEQSE